MNRCTSDFDSTARTSAGVCQSLTLRGIFWACVCVCVCVRLLQTTDDGAMTSERDESHSTSPLSVPLHPPNTDTRTPQRHTHTHTHTHIHYSVTLSHAHQCQCHSAADLLPRGSQAALTTSHPSTAALQTH